MALFVLLSLILSQGFRPKEAYSAESFVVKRYRKALELDSANESLRYQLAIALLKEKLFEEALTHLLKVGGDMSGSAETHYYLGMAYSGVGDTDMAVGEYTMVDSIDSKRARDVFELDKVFYNIGITYQREKNTRGAMAAYDKSILINSRQALAYCRRGELYFDKERYAEALEDLYICDERSPGQERTLRYIISTSLARGLSLISSERYGEALVHFEKIAALDAGNENATYFLGYTYYQQGDYIKAERALGKLERVESWEIRKNLPPLLQNIAVELQKRDEWSSASKALIQAIDYKRNDADLHYLLGYNYKNSGNRKLALTHINEALRVDPEHYKANLAFALLTERLIDQYAKKGENAIVEGDYSGAIVQFDALLEIDPTNQRASEGRARAVKSLDASRQKAAKRRFVEIDERLGEAEDYLAKGSYREALVAFRHLLALDPNNEAGLNGLSIAEGFVNKLKSAHSSRGKRYMAEENFYMALKEYKIAYDYDPDDTIIQARLKKARAGLAELVSPLLDEGAANEEDGYFARAVTAYSSALKFDPGSSEALAGKGRAAASLSTAFRKLYKKGQGQLSGADYPGAVKSFREAERFKPDDKGLKRDLAKALRGLAKVVEFKLAQADSAVERADFKAALAAYSEVSAMDAGNLTAEAGVNKTRRRLKGLTAEKLTLADKALSRGRYQSAHDLYSEVLAIDNGNRKAKTGRTKAARKLSDIAVLLKRGVSKYNSGNDLGAKAAFKGVLKTDPANRDAKSYLARIAKRAAPKLSKKEVETLYLEGIELYTDGQYVEAIGKWEKVLSGNPSHGKALFNIKKAKRKLEGVMDVK